MINLIEKFLDKLFPLPRDRAHRLIRKYAEKKGIDFREKVIQNNKTVPPFRLLSLFTTYDDLIHKYGCNSRTAVRLTKFVCDIRLQESKNEKQ